MKAKAATALLFTVAILSACDKHERSIGHQPSVLSEEKKVESKIKFKFIGTERVNRYDVYLSWPEFLPQQDCTLFRITKLERKAIATLPSATTHYTDPDIEGGESLSYELANLSQSQKTKVSFKIPEDLVLSGEMTLTDIRGVGRLFLRDGLVATTRGRKVTIEAEEVIAHKAILQSFKCGQTAPSETSGRPGGAISIFAVRASGLLNIEMCGENGGPGKDGTKGKNAVEHSATNWEPPTNGTDGTDAGNGGNSGTVLVVVKEESDLNCHISASPGKAGKRGVGGMEGQRFGFRSKIFAPGLDGNLPTDTSPKESNLDAPIKDESDLNKMRRNKESDSELSRRISASRGANGKPGKDGDKQPTCMSMAGHGDFECGHFEKEIKDFLATDSEKN